MSGQGVWPFLSHKTGWSVSHKQSAANALYDWFQIKSRKDLDGGLIPPIWESFLASYEEWKLKRKYPDNLERSQ